MSGYSTFAAEQVATSTTASAVIADNALVLGDGGVRGVKGVTNFGFGGTLLLTGISYPKVFGSNLIIGDTDIYTVPAGKKLLVMPRHQAYNPSGGSITFFPQMKVSGAYYRIGSNATVNAGAQSTSGNPTSYLVLNEGESFSINTATTAGLNYFVDCIQFDAANSLSTARVLTLANGDNTIYTVPAGKTAFPVSIFFASTSCVSVINDSGGALNYLFYCVPSGGAVGTTNQYTQTIAISDNTGSAQISPTLDAGDFIVVNTSAATATQTAWFTYYEI